MRRARIKAVATVPIRRKPIKIEDTESKNEPPDVSGAVTDGVADTFKSESLERENSNAPLGSCHGDENIQELPPSVVKNEKVSAMEIEPNDETPEILPVAPSEDCVRNHNKESTDREQKMNEDVPPAIEISDSTTRATSNVENSSPTKTTAQTRTSFMRPVPRLDGCGRTRRNSVQGSGASASESEDDSRRVITNNSTAKRSGNDPATSIQSPKPCSMASGTQNVSSASIGNIGTNPPTTATPTNTTAPPIRTTTSRGARQKRKMVVSESARKLAEARREFLLKHEHKQPDRTKLIMYDLIYYNPVTNPIKKTKDGAAATSSLTTAGGATEAQRVPNNQAESEDEDEEDDPEAPEAMPVPRVKVGPDGHLVIDEQSLVIEHTGAKRNRRAMARTEALVDEDGNGGSGFYKRRRKSKDWPKWETLKFYKALNTVGTDFLLMQSLFPERSRQEIKIKFKKEERSNRQLVEKALTYHQEFDIESLTKHLATFEEAEKSEIEPAKKNSAKKEQNSERKKRIRSRRVAALGVPNQIETTDKITQAESEKQTKEGNLLENHPLEPNSTEEPKNTSDFVDSLKNIATKSSVDPKNVKKYKRILSNDSNESEIQRKTTTVATNVETTSLNLEDSGSDTEIYRIKPTRSGRKPKVRKLQAPTINTLDALESKKNNEFKRESERNDKKIDEEMKKNEEIESTTIESQEIDESLPGISEVEPGSLVIVSRESPEDPGETMLQVYMVSSDISDSKDNSSSKSRNITPVILTPELLNTVASEITKISPIDLKKQ